MGNVCTGGNSGQEHNKTGSTVKVNVWTGGNGDQEKNKTGSTVNVWTGGNGDKEQNKTGSTVNVWTGGNGDQEQNKTEALKSNVCTAEPQDTFMWRIERFSSLSELPAASCVSRPFKFGGYSWNLQIRPRNIGSKSGKECMGLYLYLDDASSLPLDLVLKTAFELCVYDQLRNSHQMFPANFYFRNQSGSWGFPNLVHLDSLKDLASGYLVNDACHVSVKFVEFCAQKADLSNMFECLSLQEKPAAQGFTWKIEKFRKLPRPAANSRSFVAGGHKWNIRVYPDGIKKSSDYLGIFLELQATPALPFKSEVFAEYSLSLLDQINGKHEKFTTKHRFSDDSRVFGLFKFLPLKDFQDPSKGFLVKNACVIEASVMVLGSSTRP